MLLGKGAVNIRKRDYLQPTTLGTLLLTCLALYFGWWGPERWVGWLQGLGWVRGVVQLGFWSSKYVWTRLREVGWEERGDGHICTKVMWPAGSRVSSPETLESIYFSNRWWHVIKMWHQRMRACPVSLTVISLATLETWQIQNVV